VAERNAYGLFASYADQPDHLEDPTKLIIELEDVERFIYRPKDASAALRAMPNPPLMTSSSPKSAASPTSLPLQLQ
jgi:hypothetical protein